MTASHQSNPFAGSWRGTWQGRQSDGSWTWHVSPDGIMSGTADTKGNPVTGTFTGRITGSGELSYSYKYKAERIGKGVISFLTPDTLHVRWKDFDDGFLYNDGESTMKRIEPI